MESSARRRRRPAVSCILCRQRKIRCNRETPCNNCRKSKNATCVYRDVPQLASQKPNRISRADAPADPLTPSSAPSALSPHHLFGPTGPTATTTTTATGDADNDHGGRGPGTRTRTAPEGAQSAGPSAANSPVSTFTRNSRVETREVKFNGDFYFHSEQRTGSHFEAVAKRVTHKTRHFGPSHWANAVALLQDIFKVLETHLRDDKSSLFKTQKRCKALARIIKARRAPPWPCVPTPELPARAVADVLVDCYLTSREPVLRILHVPSFKREYEAVWDPSSTPDPTFLVQLKLVMALGTVTYDAAFSMRPLAMRWIYEAQTWLSAPEFKSRLVISSVQTSILHLLARDAVGVGEDLVWANLGTVLRMAIYMGLHRDPAGLGPKSTSPLILEMRRRLWSSLLELVLHSSIVSGGPPLLNIDDFDTEPPRNFDDEQLTGAADENPVPKPDDQFTQTTIAIALRKLVPLRLTIVKYINDLSSVGSYTETLRLDRELREAYKTLTRTLQSCKHPASGATPGRGPSDVDLRTVDILLRRYFLSLHMPFFGLALQETAFAYSRRVVVDTALRLWRSAFPHPLAATTAEAADADDPLTRTSIGGGGFFRTIALQGFVAVALEMRALLGEEDGGLAQLGGGSPVELRPDLQLALKDYCAWAWRLMETGETNSKVYLVPSMLLAQVGALKRGMSDEEAAPVIVRAAEEAEERCLALLTEVEARGQPQGGEGGMNVGGGGGSAEMMGGGVLQTPPEVGIEEWDYMQAADFYFDPAAAQAFSWAFQQNF